MERRCAGSDVETPANELSSQLNSLTVVSVLLHQTYRYKRRRGLVVISLRTSITHSTLADYQPLPPAQSAIKEEEPTLLSMWKLSSICSKHDQSTRTYSSNFAKILWRAFCWKVRKEKTALNGILHDTTDFK